jgi:hypothetical protein
MTVHTVIHMTNAAAISEALHFLENFRSYPFSVIFGGLRAWKTSRISASQRREL